MKFFKVADTLFWAGDVLFVILGSDNLRQP